MGMILFVFAIIVFLAALGCIAGAMFDDVDRAGWAAGAVIGIIVALILLFSSMFREVPTNSIGVPTAFGHVETTLRPGLHIKAPWTRVNILDENVQTTTFEGSNCLDVRIGGQQTACLDATIQWRVNDSGAGQLFQNYNNGGGIMNNITDSVVIREFKSVVNQVLGDYNPIQDVALNSGSGNSQFSKFGPVVETTMKTDLTGQIIVKNVYMPLLHYDTATQGRLNQIQAQYAETAIAKELQVTNDAQSKANKAIGTPTLAQLQYLCYQIVQTAEKTGFTGLPATFSCQPGSSAVAVSTGK